MSCLAQIQCKPRDGSRLLCHTICPIHKRFTTALLELQATVHDFPLEGSLVSCQSAWILNPDRNHLKSENVVYTTFVSWNLLGRLPNGIYERLAPYTLQSRSYLSDLPKLERRMHATYPFDEEARARRQRSCHCAQRSIEHKWCQMFEKRYYSVGCSKSQDFLCVAL